MYDSNMATILILVLILVLLLCIHYVLGYVIGMSEVLAKGHYKGGSQTKHTFTIHSLSLQ